MTRGNQREIDRQRAANRHAHKKDDSKKSGDFLVRREADAAALAEKVARKKAAEEAAARGETTEPVKQKPVVSAIKKEAKK